MSNPYSALCDSSDSETEDVQSELVLHETSPRYYNAMEHEGGMKVQIETGTSDELPFSSDDLDTAVKVLHSIGENIYLLRLPLLKPVRAALHPLIAEQQKKYTAESQPKDRNRKKRKLQDKDRDREELLAELERNHINHTQMKAIRMKNLEKLNEEIGEAPRVPDGVAELETPPLLLLGNAEECVGSSTGDSTMSSHFKSIDLKTPIKCYICSRPYTKLHFFYHQLCPDCAAFNFGKRSEMADLSGRVCLVTGGRTKIGFRSALKLLRCGAVVIVTTRFPVDASSRYAAEKDSGEWMHRLQVYGLDFRDLSRLEAFCCHLEQTYDRLDAIVNNAAQTIRRPPAYYSHLMEKEKLIEFSSDQSSSASEESAAPSGSPPSSRMQQALRGQRLFSSTLLGIGNTSNRALTEKSSEGNMGGSSSEGSSSEVASVSLGSGMSSSEMTQMSLISGEERQSEYFPVAVTDVNGQQVDLRRQNSWTMRLNEIPTVELAEVFAINTIAPTIINSRLKNMMLRRPEQSTEESSNLPRKKGKLKSFGPESWKFVVNVSAMEGKFYRYKGDTHPHTNMAKAALNMMTRTSAQDYVKSGIYMTAVDTGWINDEKPIELAMAHEKTHNFQTPLDEVDAASRVLDPIIGPLHVAQELDRSSGGKADLTLVEPPWGYFLKDYVKTEW